MDLESKQTIDEAIDRAHGALSMVVLDLAAAFDGWVLTIDVPQIVIKLSKPKV